MRSSKVPREELATEHGVQVAGPTIGGTTATPYNSAKIEAAKEHLVESVKGLEEDLTKKNSDLDSNANKNRDEAPAAGRNQHDQNQTQDQGQHGSSLKDTVVSGAGTVVAGVAAVPVAVLTAAMNWMTPKGEEKKEDSKEEENLKKKKEEEDLKKEEEEDLKKKKEEEDLKKKKREEEDLKKEEEHLKKKREEEDLKKKEDLKKEEDSKKSNSQYDERAPRLESGSPLDKVESPHPHHLPSGTTNTKDLPIASKFAASNAPTSHDSSDKNNDHPIGTSAGPTHTGTTASPSYARSTGHDSHSTAAHPSVASASLNLGQKQQQHSKQGHDQQQQQHLPKSMQGHQVPTAAVLGATSATFPAPPVNDK
ncbi:hypothetical protein BGZ65_011862, partial [Modicella reniformis]